MAWCLNTLSLDKDNFILSLNEKRLSLVSVFFKYLTEVGILLYLSFSERNQERMSDFIESFQRKENIIALLINPEILCKALVCVFTIHRHRLYL